MWELICHHTYKLDGEPVDQSVYSSRWEAIDTTFLPDGIAPGSGTFNFHSAGHVRITVDSDTPASLVWRKLGGLKIEVTARLNGYRALPRVLIGSVDSFLFCVWERELIASYWTTKPTWPGANHERIGAISDSIQDPPYRVPFDKWVTFGFVHDGLDIMELYADGQPVARRTGLLAGVPGVDIGKSVFIGTSGGTSGIYTSHVLDGAIDEIKVWRLDPDVQRRQFLARPYDQATANCWEQFLRSLREALAKRPDCAQLLGRGLASVLDRLRRAIVAKGPGTRERYARHCREYARLWKSGQLDGPEMKRLFAEWCTWLRLVGISIEDDPELQQLLQEPCLKEVLAECKGLECDPQAAALVQLIAESCSPNRNAAT